MQVRTKDKLRAAANDHMTMLESNPIRVASYFQDPRVQYANRNYLMAESIGCAEEKFDYFSASQDVSCK